MIYQHTNINADIGQLCQPVSYQYNHSFNEFQVFDMTQFSYTKELSVSVELQYYTRGANPTTLFFGVDNCWSEFLDMGVIKYGLHWNRFSFFTGYLYFVSWQELRFSPG